MTTVKRGPTTFVAVDGGMGDNLEVALFGQRFEAGIADRLDAAGGEPVTVVGRHCESGDVLVDGVPLAAPRVGDLLAVPATGAYCFTMSQQLQRQPADPRRVRRGRAQARLVVRRETWEDLTVARHRVKCQTSCGCSIPGQGDQVTDGGRQSCLR